MQYVTDVRRKGKNERGISDYGEEKRDVELGRI